MIKKLIVFSGLLFAFCQAGFCDTLADQFEVALFGHTETIMETTTKGNTYAELLATPIQIGQVAGGYLVGVDAGVLGNVAPGPGQGGFKWTVGVHAHLTPLIKKYIFTSISQNYPAINGIEIDPRASLDFEDGHKDGVFGISAGYAWGGAPLQ